MSLPLVSDSSLGDSTHVGGVSWNKLARLLNGTSNVLNVDINSLFKFRDAKCQFLGTNGTSIISIRTGFINQTLAYYLPAPFDSSDDTLMTNRGAATVSHKIFDSSNTLLGTVQMPSARKWGAVMIGPDTGAEGLGLLSGFAHRPAVPVYQVGATNGLNWRYNSGSSANTRTGITMGTSDSPAGATAFACRAFHSMLRAKTRVLTGPAATRQYVGFSTQQLIPNTDTPLGANDSGVLVGWRTSDAGTAIQVFRNSGTAATSSTATVVATSPVVAPSTAVTQFEVSFPNDTDATVRVLSAGGGTVLYTGTFTTNIPASGTMMYPSAVSTTTGTAANYDIYFVETSQDQ